MAELGCSKNQSSCSILHALKLISTCKQGLISIKQSITIIYAAGNKRMNKSFCRLSNEIFPDASNIVKMVKCCFTNLVNMCSHCKITVKLLAKVPNEAGI